jgi:hypothetical protein
MLSAPDQMMKRAPKFWNEWFKHLEAKPEIKAAFLETWEFLNRSDFEVGEMQRVSVGEMFARGDETILRKRQERFLWKTTAKGIADAFKLALWNQYQMPVDAARKVGGPIAKELEMFFDEQPLAGNLLFIIAKQVQRAVIDPLEADQIPWDDFGAYLFHNRIVNESYSNAQGEEVGRGKLANPLGWTPELSRKQLKWMEALLGPDRAAQPGGSGLERAARALQDMFYEALQEGVEAGTISKKTFDEVIIPNRYAYATFATVEGIEHSDWVPAGLKQQIGTLSDIVNPATAEIMKLMALKRLNQRNRGLAKLMDEILVPLGEATAAPMRFDGKKWDCPPAPKGKTIQYILRDGHRVGYYMPATPIMGKMVPLWQDVFSNTSPAALDAVMNVLNWPFRKIFYPLFITYNPRFEMWANWQRDLQRTARNLYALGAERGALGPYKVLWNVLEEHRKVWPQIKQMLKTGETTPLLEEAIEAAAIMPPSEAAVLGLDNENKALAAILMQTHMMPLEQQRPFLNNWLLRNLKKINVFKFFQYVGQAEELNMATSGYTLAKRYFNLDPHPAGMVRRNFLSTPNYMKKGKYAQVARFFLPFYNIVERALESDGKLMTGKQTRARWWYAYITMQAPLTIVAALAEAGILGLATAALYKAIPQRDKAGNNAIPLGRGIGKRFLYRTAYMWIPCDETARILNAILYVTITRTLKAVKGADQRPLAQDMADITQYTGGLLPGVNPLLTIAGALKDYFEGNNPPSGRAGNSILSQSEETLLKSGGPFKREPVVGMLKWGAQQSGLTSYVRWQPDGSLAENILVNTAPLKGIFKLSDGGLQEEENIASIMKDTPGAQIHAWLQPNTLKALREYYRLMEEGERGRMKIPDGPLRYERLGSWVQYTYSPARDRAMDALEDGDREKARKAVKDIPAP